MNIYQYSDEIAGHQVEAEVYYHAHPEWKATASSPGEGPFIDIREIKVTRVDDIPATPYHKDRMETILWDDPLLEDALMEDAWEREKERDLDAKLEDTHETERLCSVEHLLGLFGLKEKR